MISFRTATRFGAGVPKATQAASVPRAPAVATLCRAVHRSRATAPKCRAYTSSSAPSRSPALAFKREPEPVPVIQANEAYKAPELPRVTAGERDIFIHWEGAEWSRFHNLWLRDHCRCAECFHPVTKQRLFSTFDIPPDIEPASARPTPEGLEVVWQPASMPHTSLYPWSWLHYNTYDPPRPPEESEKVLWGAKIQQDPPTVAYEEAMADDGYGLYKWLSKIDRFGFCFVSGVPPTPEATEELTLRMGFIRETHYGKFWDFTADLARGDTAYTNLALPAHTDSTYFSDPCGIQLFHLLSHTNGTGGATLLVDGFYVASILKDLHPDTYEFLSTASVPAHAAGEEGVLYRASAPVLAHDARIGVLRRVRWNNDDRSVVRSIEARDVPRLYEAMRTWNKLLTSPDSEYWVQLTPGTVIAIDNHRVLHGRSAFNGTRRMCGAYVGADEFRSRLAVLGERFAPKVEGGEGRTAWSVEF
ncbi:Trimethyllysine dioxygenase [Vararia minispora EC-137]|uniref:Trimethyllysine dioxygenase n=1 Tax=Vararia minispora EC-137 TaxID=1314806 RepID=A0ACB8QBT6_9AGAM|nr:Trimethyllysine dioxygenase [Vararia minispora EC-137]